MMDVNQDFKHDAPEYIIVARGEKCVVTAQNLHVARRIIHKIFYELKFPTPAEKSVVRESYMINLIPLILYAKENGLNLYGYLNGIQQELLKDSHVHRR